MSKQHYHYNPLNVVKRRHKLMTVCDLQIIASSVSVISESNIRNKWHTYV